MLTDALPAQTLFTSGEDFHHFRIAVDGWVSKRQDKVFLKGSNVDDGIIYDPDWVNGLNSGVAGSLACSYFWNPWLGAGLKYSGDRYDFNKTYSPDVPTYQGGESLNKFEDIIWLHYLGPTMDFRWKICNSPFTLQTALGAGLLMTHEHYNIYGDKFGDSKYAPALSGDLGIDISVWRNVALGLQISGLVGKTSKIEFSPNSNPYTYYKHSWMESEYMRLIRLDPSIGLRYVFL